MCGTSVVRRPEDRSREHPEVLAKVKAGHSVENIETVRLRKDGTALPLVFTVSPVHGADGTVVAVDSIVRDMTEKERAGRYARTLIEAALDPMVTISPEGKIDDVNEATIKITGVPREKLIGSEYSQYLTEPDKAIDFIQDVLSRGVLTDVRLTVHHQDGTLTHVLCDASVYRDFNGDVLGVLAIGRDVTKTQ
jgi:PAS domain S-box-containing protein